MPRDDFNRAFQVECAHEAHLYGTAYTSLELEVGTDVAQALAAAVLPAMVNRCAEVAAARQAHSRAVVQAFPVQEMW